MATLYPPANLQSQDSLLDTDDIARYCSPSKYNLEENAPKVGAFILEGDPPELSVNRLQHYSTCNEAEAVALIRDEVGKYLELRERGRFVVLNVGSILARAEEKEIPLDIIFTPTPLEGKLSHSSVTACPDLDRTRTATMLMRMSTKERTYEAVE